MSQNEKLLTKSVSRSGRPGLFMYWRNGHFSATTGEISSWPGLISGGIAKINVLMRNPLKTMCTSVTNLFIVPMHLKKNLTQLELSCSTSLELCQQLMSLNGYRQHKQSLCVV